MPDINMLATLVQLGPTGAGLAFSLLGFWLLQREQGLKDPAGAPAPPRSPMLQTIRFFIGIALIAFVIGTTASLVTLFGEKIVRANAGTLSSALSTDLIAARFTSWEADTAGGKLTFGVSRENLDLARFVSKSNPDAFRLVVGVRAKSATPHDAGSYLMAFGYFPFDSISPQAEPKIEPLRDAACIEFVLFRVNKSAADKIPLKRPFEPASYGEDVRVINTAYDGKNCP